MYAAQKNLSKVAKLLLESGANPNLQSHSGETALFFNIVNGSAEIESLPLNSTKISKYGGETALMYTIIYNSIDVAKLLLENGANPNLQNSGGDTPLIFASIMNNSKVLKMLLKYKADPNLENRAKKKPNYASSSNE